MNKAPGLIIALENQEEGAMDTQIGTYSLNDFAEEFKALLRKAEDAGLEVDDFCTLAEGIIDVGWMKGRLSDQS